MENYKSSSVKMDYYKDSFVHKNYPNNYYGVIEEVEERNPFNIEDDGQMISFNFYDREVWDGGSESWIISNTNFSGIIYFGKRYTYEELLNMYKNMSLKDRLVELYRTINYMPTIHKALKFMESNDLKIICIDRFNGYHQINDNDITYDELMEKKSKTMVL